MGGRRLWGVAATVVAASVAITAVPAWAAEYAATATMTPRSQLLGDTSGTAFTFTVANTGTTSSIGAVEISRPSNQWTILSCSGQPAGWTAQVADQHCRFRSAAGQADDLRPGASTSFTVVATTRPGTTDRRGTWQVVVSRSNQFDNKRLLLTAAAPPGTLATTAHSWQVLDAVVVDGAAPAAGASCPAGSRSAVTGSTVTIVVCGRNRSSVTGTPVAAFSSLAGSFVSSPGTFTSGPVTPGSASVVLGVWSGAGITSSSGAGKTVLAAIGAAANSTSAVTLLSGYEALNQPPDAVDDEGTTNEDTAVTIAVLGNDTDADNDPLTVTAVDTAATAGEVTLVAGDVRYDPADAFQHLAQGASDTDTFEYTAADPFGASDTARVSVTIEGRNDPPVANADVATTTEGAATDVDVTDNDTDVDDGSVLSVASASIRGGGGGALSFAGRTIRFDPNGAFDALAPAAQALVVIDYTVTDGTATASSTLTVTVTGTNDPPIAAPDEGSTDQDTAVVVDVLANDTDVDGPPLTIGAVQQPAQGSVTVVAGGLRFDPGDGFRWLAQDAFDTATFTYQASDGIALSTPAQVSVRIDGVNDPPTAQDDQASTSKTSPVAIPVLANDDDVDLTATLSIVSATPGTNGTVTVVGSNVVYAPGASVAGLAPGASVDDSFTYTVQDEFGLTDTATVTVRIDGENTAPVAVADGVSPVIAIAEDDVATPIAVLANDTDAEGDGLTVLEVTGVSAGATAVIGGAGSGVDVTPPAAADALRAGQSTTVTFSYRATDGSLSSNSAAVTVQVSGVNDPPVALDDTETTTEQTPVSIDVRANDTDPDTGDTLTVTMIELPARGSASIDVLGDVVFDPGTAFDTLQPGQSDTESFTYTITDGSGATSTATITVTVTGRSAPPTATNDTAAAVGNTLLQGSGLLANDSDPDGPLPLTTVAGAVTSTAGGTVQILANGAYTYLPPVGFTGPDSFDYVVQDGDGNQDVGTVSVTVADLVWYVSASAAPGGDGRSTSPFQGLGPLTGPADVDGAGAFLYLAPGTYAGGLTLEAGQRLFGPKQALVVGAVTLVPAQPLSASPVITGGLVLASNVNVQGVDVGEHTGGHALRGTAVSGPVVGTTAPVNVTNPGRPVLLLDGGSTGVQIRLATISGGGTLPVQLLGVGGTIDLGPLAPATTSGGTLSNTTGDAVRVEGGNLTLTIRNVTFSTIGTSNAGETIRDLDAVDVRAAANQTTTVTVHGAVVTDTIGKTLRVTADVTGVGGVVNATLSNATVTGVITPAGVAGDRSGGVLLRSRRHTARVTVTGSTFTNVADGDGAISADVGATGNARLTVNASNITGSSATGVQALVNSADGDSSAQLDIINNSIAGSGSDGVQVANFGGTGVSTVLLDLRGNAIPSHSTGGPAVAFSGGVGIYGFEDNLCARILGNVVAAAAGLPGFTLDGAGGSSLTVQADAGVTNVNAFISGSNGGATVVSSGATLSNGAACPFAP